MADKKELTLKGFGIAQGIIEELKNPQTFTATATGIAVSDKREWILSAGKLLQATIGGSLFKQLGEELGEYSEKGQIKKNFVESSYNQSCLLELLKFIDEEAPDEERFGAMKSIFLISVKPDTSKDGEVLAYQLMQICKKLSSAEILILKAAYAIANGHLAPGVVNMELNASPMGAIAWCSIVAKQVGHNITGLVEHYDQHLMDLRLILERTYSDKSGINKGQHFRLADLGYKLCEFISNFQELPK